MRVLILSSLGFAAFLVVAYMSRPGPSETAPSPASEQAKPEADERHQFAATLSKAAAKRSFDGAFVAEGAGNDTLVLTSVSCKAQDDAAGLLRKHAAAAAKIGFTSFRCNTPQDSSGWTFSPADLQ